MKRNIIKALVIASAIPAMFVMTSCKEQPNSKELYVYINSEIQPRNQADTYISIDLLKTGEEKTITGKQSLKFPLKANRPLPASATCVIAPAPDLLATYNREFKVDAQLLPESYVSLPKGTKFTLGQGMMIGTDSLEVKIGDLSAFDVSKRATYVYPYRIVSISSDDKGLTYNANYSIVYAVVKVTRSQEFDIAMTDTSAMTGKLVDGSSLTIKGASNPGRLIDGNVTPAWNPQQSAMPSVIINLNGEKTLTGFRTWPDYNYPEETVKRCRIDVSNDGVEWIGQAYVELPATTGTKKAPIWRYTKIAEPIKASYVRMQSLSTYDPNNWTGLSEFQLYAQ